MWQWGQCSSHLGLNWRCWVSVGDREGHHTAWVRRLDSGKDVCMYVCVWVEGLTHTRATPLSADAENMFVWDKSTKTHPSTGSKYALRHCWHGVNNLTLTEVGEACGRMEAGTEREMDWAVIDIQFELLQIFPFSGKMRTSLSAHAVGQVRAIFQSTQFWSKVYLRVVSVHCCRSENKQWPCP